MVADKDYSMDVAIAKGKAKRARAWAFVLGVVALALGVVLAVGTIHISGLEAQLAKTNEDLTFANERLAGLDENTVPRIMEAYIGERYFCNDQGLGNYAATDYVKNATRAVDGGLETIYRCMFDDGSEVQYYIRASPDGQTSVARLP